MALCVKCGGFTKFNGGKCYSCYKKDDSNAETSTIKETSKTSDEGLSKKALNYRYNMIKGRIAETLIQELFLSLDYNVFHYGYSRF